jgi:hypothetical protein
MRKRYIFMAMTRKERTERTQGGMGTIAEGRAMRYTRAFLAMQAGLRDTGGVLRWGWCLCFYGWISYGGRPIMKNDLMIRWEACPRLCFVSSCS